MRALQIKDWDTRLGQIQKPLRTFWEYQDPNANLKQVQGLE